jgi:hypothetical protein
MLPPLRETPREPVLTRMQIDVRRSVLNPQYVILPQIRQGCFLPTRWKPPDGSGARIEAAFARERLLLVCAVGIADSVLSVNGER